MIVQPKIGTTRCEARCREWLLTARSRAPQDKHNRVATRRIPRVKNHGGQHLSKGAPLLGTPRMRGPSLSVHGGWALPQTLTPTTRLARPRSLEAQRSQHAAHSESKSRGGAPFQVCRGLAHARGGQVSARDVGWALSALSVRRRLPLPRPRRHALPSLQAPRGRLCREAVSRSRRARAVIRASNHHLCSPIFRPGRAIISTDAPAPATRLLGVESRGLEPRRLSLR